MRIVISTATWYAEDKVRVDLFERAVREAAPGHDVVFAGKGEDLPSAMADAVVFFPLSGHSFTEEVLNAAPLLEWVHLASAGVDHALFPILMERPITVTNGAGVYAVPIAEHVLAMMLALSRRIPETVRQQIGHSYAGLRGGELAGGTVLIVGLGGIGTRVAALCKAFGMRVLGTRRHPNGPLDNVDQVFPGDQLRDALPVADWIVLCAPLTPETRHLIGRDEIALMKPSARLVNIARGDIIVEDALVDALCSGRIAGAGLDVFSIEPLPATSLLWETPNLLISPHSGGSSPNSLTRTLDLFLDNLRRFLAAEPLRNVVDKQAGY